MATEFPHGLSSADAALKRVFDCVVALSSLVVFTPLIGVSILVATIDTGAFGVFTQTRIGRYGKNFKVFKVRTMKTTADLTTSVTTCQDRRITGSGRWLRRLKLDELPQLYNVLIGDMSLVGPRPDVPGFADTLTGEDRIVLTVRPGITGPATLRYRDEEKILSEVSDPETYNMEVLFPAKVAVNKEYIRNYSIALDLKYIWLTIAGGVYEDGK